MLQTSLGIEEQEYEASLAEAKAFAGQGFRGVPNRASEVGGPRRRCREQLVPSCREPTAVQWGRIHVTHEIQSDLTKSEREWIYLAFDNSLAHLRGLWVVCSVCPSAWNTG